MKRGSVGAEGGSRVQGNDVDSDGELENIANETMRGDLETNISECRKVMEEMLVKLHDLAAKVSILVARVTKVSTGSFKWHSIGRWISCSQVELLHE